MWAGDFPLLWVHLALCSGHTRLNRQMGIFCLRDVGWGLPIPLDQPQSSAHARLRLTSKCTNSSRQTEYVAVWLVSVIRAGAYPLLWGNLKPANRLHDTRCCTHAIIRPSASHTRSTALDSKQSLKPTVSRISCENHLERYIVDRSFCYAVYGVLHSTPIGCKSAYLKFARGATNLHVDMCKERMRKAT